MSKKSLDKKNAQKNILASRDIGKSDQEIYFELVEQYYDKKGVALLIAGTPTLEAKEKYKIYNWILLGLLGVTIIFKLLFVLQLTISTGNVWALMFIFVVPLINIMFFVEVARYVASIYRVVGIVSIMSFTQSMGMDINGVSILINTLLLISIVSLAFFLDSRLFPNYKPTNMQMDATGEYILG